MDAQRWYRDACHGHSATQVNGRGMEIDSCLDLLPQRKGSGHMQGNCAAFKFKATKCNCRCLGSK